jgi:beta-galactosidase
MLKDMETLTAPKVNQVSSQLLEITGEKVSWLFDLLHGSLVSMRKGGVEMLHSPPVLDFYRAVTDNDRPKFGQSWFDARVHQTKQHFRSTAWSLGDGVNIVVTSRIAPPVLEWSVDTVTSYSFTNQKLSIRVSGIPRGNKLPSTFPRMGLTLALNDIENVCWFGRGPGESYRDKKLSQKFGNHSLPIDDLFVDYEFPQETSNRTDVRWVQFSTKDSGPSLKAHFGALQGASFSALHYTTKDLDECGHPYELKKKRKEETIVRLDWAHHGLGTGSCGPETLPEYELRSGVFDYEVLLE